MTGVTHNDMFGIELFTIYSRHFKGLRSLDPRIDGD